MLINNRISRVRAIPENQVELLREAIYDIYNTQISGQIPFWYYDLHEREVNIVGGVHYNQGDYTAGSMGSMYFDITLDDPIIHHIYVYPRYIGSKKISPNAVGFEILLNGSMVLRDNWEWVIFQLS